MEGHNETIHNISILPNNMIISQSYRLLKMWNPINGECVSSWEKEHIYYCIVLKNGLVGCAENGKICIYY